MKTLTLYVGIGINQLLPEFITHYIEPQEKTSSIHHNNSLKFNKTSFSAKHNVHRNKNIL